ncbi:monocarboxylate transporter 13-like [Glandiceps talaboti]
MADRFQPSRESPDGGWGWVIVFATFVSCAATSGSIYSFSVLYVAFLDAFGESKADTAWVGSILIFLYGLASPFGVTLARKIGHRRTAMFSGFLVFIGLFTSSFASHLVILYFTYGIVIGTGCGLAFMTCVEIISVYFKRRLTIALGIAMAGTGAGQFVLSLFSQYLLDIYGWRGTLLIFSALSLNICVAGALMRPLIMSENNDLNEATSAITKSGIDDRRGQILDLNTNINPSPNEQNEPFCHVRRAVDFGITNYYSSLIPALMGLTQLIARPLWGVVGHIRGLRANIPYGCAFAICGTAALISTYTKTFAGQVIFIIIYGICNGGCSVFMPLVVSDFLGPNRIGYGSSFLYQVYGVTILLVSPLAGLIRDETGVYDWAFWMAGAAALLAAVLAFLLPVVEKVVKRKRQRYTEETDITVGTYQTTKGSKLDSESVIAKLLEAELLPDMKETS